MSSENQKYLNEITKKLNAFKKAKEWSDFISLLTSLDNIIKSFSLPYIPMKEMLCKRLNQCLNPLLPAGVHNKVLETYSIIFESISKTEFIENFPIYTLGLYTFGSYSRILVITPYLDVIEKYIIPLGENIQIYSANILLGLLPSMESESNEFYNRSFLIVNNFRSNISDEYFYTAMWEIFLTEPGLRLSIVNYFLNTPLDVKIMVPDKSIAVKALCEGLKSNETLIIRGTIDLISHMFPIQNDILSKDLIEELLEGMFRLFLKRDLSLNKRVFNWMNVGESFTDNDIARIKSTLLRLLKNKRNIKLFFKIFTTLSDKGGLSEKILEVLLFKVLICIEDLKNSSTSKIVEESNNVTEEINKDIITLSRTFITLDLDILWKIFYLEMKSSIEVIPKPISKDEEKVKEFLSGDVDIFSEASEVSLLNNLGDDISLQNKDESYSKDISVNKHSKPRKPRKKNISNAMKEEEIEDYDENLLPTEVLKYINYCIDYYNIFDETVLKKHLPILTIFILENKKMFNKETFYEYLNKTVSRIKLENQEVSGLSNFFSLIDDFYKNENPKVLNTIEPHLVYLIRRYISRLTEEEIEDSHLIFITFVLNHEGVYPFRSEIETYYKNILISSSQIIGDSERLFERVDTKQLKCELMFNELWNRLFYEDANLSQGVLNVQGGPQWNLQSDVVNSELEKMTLTQNAKSIKASVAKDIITSTHPSAIMETVFSKRKNSPSMLVNNDNFLNDIRTSETDKKYIVILLYRYNIIFRRKFENYLLKKVNKSTNDTICLFLHYLFEIPENEKFYFYNIFFIINTKISKDDPMITALINSIGTFDGVFSYLIEKFKNSNIVSEKYIYVDDPNFNQLKGVIKCFKNLLNYSRRFRSDIVEEKKKVSCDFFDNRTEVSFKMLVYNILKYLFICDLKKSNPENDFSDELSTFEIKEKMKFYENAVNTIRDIKIESMKLIKFMLDNNLLSKKDIYDGDIDKIVEIAYEFRLDPGIIMPTATLIKATDDLEIISRFCTIINYKCFFYYDLLEFVFSIKEGYKRKVLLDIHSSLDNNGFSIMIMHEVIKEMLNMNDKGFNWAEIIKDVIKRIILFYEHDYLDINQYQDETDEDIKSHFDEYSDPVKKEGNLQGVRLINFNPHIQALKVNAIVETSYLLFSKVSGYFIEYLISSPYSEYYMKDIYFKKDLYAQLLLTYNNNKKKTFEFILKFDDLIEKKDQNKIFVELRETYQHIISYNQDIDTDTLLYLLKVFSRIEGHDEDASSLLSIIYQTISYLQKKICLQKGFNQQSFKKFAQLLDFLALVNYKKNIKSALQTNVGFLFELIKSSDKYVKHYAVDTLISLTENKTVSYINWIREFMEYFNSSDFFAFKLKEKKLLTSKLVLNRIEVIDDCILKLDSSFFASQASDINNKCIVLKRIAFLLYSAPYNKYVSFSTKLVEIIANLMQHTSSRVRRKLLSLIKIILYKISHERLLTLFPIIYSEVLTILDKISDEDLGVVSEVVKILDILFLLNTPHTLEFKEALFGINLIKSEDMISSKEIEESICLSKETIFSKATQKLVEKHNFQIHRNYQFFKQKKLFYRNKKLRLEEIASFFAYAPLFFTQQNRICDTIDLQSLEKYLLSEFFE